MGGEFTLQCFAAEHFGGEVDAVMLGYIEKGQHFPNEALVRRLAVVREQPPRELLALFARDRILKTITKELARLLEAPAPVDGVTDAEMAVRVSQAIAALPDYESWVPPAAWREEFCAPPKRQKKKAKLDPAATKRVEVILKAQGLIEVRGTRARRRGRHYEPREVAHHLQLALEYCVLFLKGLLNRLAMPDVDTGTYLRDHHLSIERNDVAEFERELDDAVSRLAEKYAADPSDATTEFINVLTTVTLT